MRSGVSVFFVVVLGTLVQLAAANCGVGQPCNGVCCGPECHDTCQGLVCVNNFCQTPTPPPPPPCGPQACFSTKFNSQPVPSGDVIWLSAAFKPKFQGGSATVSFTNSHVTINGVSVSSSPDSFIQLDSTLQSCGTANFVSGAWHATAPLPGSGSTFLSAVSIPVPPGVNYANAEVKWCGDVAAPGEIDVQIAAAVYTSCSEATANPEACETHTNYHAGVPTGCLNNLVPGGTGGGGSNYSGSLSATYAVCRTN